MRALVAGLALALAAPTYAQAPVHEEPAQAEATGAAAAPSGATGEVALPTGATGDVASPTGATGELGPASGLVPIELGAAGAAAEPPPVIETPATEPPPAEAASDAHAGDHAGAAEQGGVEHATSGHGSAEHATAEHAGGEHEQHGENWIARFLNFGIFVGFLFYVLHKPLRAFFAKRKVDIVTSLEGAEKAQQEAQAKLSAMEARLAALDQQVADILAKAEQHAAAEKAIIIENAKASAQKLLAQAEAQVADLEAASVRRLKAMAADMAVQAAREIIEKQLKPEDRSRFFERTLKGLQKTAGQ